MSSLASSVPNRDKPLKVVMRHALPSDIGVIADIFLDARASTMAYVPNLYSKSEIRDWLADELIRRCDVTIACIDGRVAGFSVRRDRWLEQLYVHPDHQCRGVGSLLVECAKRASAGVLRLHVFQQNLRARRFYARHGFIVESLRDKSQNEEQVADMVCIWQARG